MRRLLLRPRVRIMLWWLASVASLVIYAPLRGCMDDLGMPVHGAEVEEGLFRALPTLWLQHHVYSLSPRVLEWAAVVIHSSWFFVPLLAAAVVVFRRPERVGSFFIRWITLQAIVLPLFALFPLRPPWMADHEVIRVIALRFGGQIDDSNPLAAMPSLHVAFPLMIALWFLRERWKLPAIIMLIYSAIVGFEVVFSGEHYVVDVMGATVVAAVVILLGEVDYSHVLDRARQALAKRPALGLLPQPAAFISAAKRFRQTQRGQTLIEFAFVAPIILVFLFTIVDFGLALDRRITLQHAVDDGARRGVVDPDIARTIAYTENESQGLLDNKTQPGAVVVCFMNDDGDGTWGEVGDSIVVKSDFDYNYTMGFGELVFDALKINIPHTIKLNPSATKRLEATAAVAVGDRCPP